MQRLSDLNIVLDNRLFNINVRDMRIKQLFFMSNIIRIYHYEILIAMGGKHEYGLKANRYFMHYTSDNRNRFRIGETFQRSFFRRS